METLERRTAAGHAVYTPFTLRFYDVVVHGVTNPLVWGCPTRQLVDWYAAHVRARHADVGVGTGYLLERATARIDTLTLIDLNEHSLRVTADKLAALRPKRVRANVLEPLPSGLGPFDSIGLGYLLHCVPGAIGGPKAAAFDHLASTLAPGGVLFGATVLAERDVPSLRAKALMALYNQRGIFHNREDTLAGLVAALASRFESHEVHRVGAVALFSARGYRAAVFGARLPRRPGVTQ